MIYWNLKSKTQLSDSDLAPFLLQIAGDWVLVWSVAAAPKAFDVLKNLSSSYTEFQILPDNNTIMFTESNMMR